MKLSAFLSMLGLAVLSGCASVYPTSPTAVHQPMSARPDGTAPVTVANGAIFQAVGSRPLFEDRRARHVGDTITINLV